MPVTPLTDHLYAATRSGMILRLTRELRTSIEAKWPDYASRPAAALELETTLQEVELLLERAVKHEGPALDRLLAARPTLTR